jgi:hypothetical protein
MLRVELNEHGGNCCINGRCEKCRVRRVREAKEEFTDREKLLGECIEHLHAGRHSEAMEAHRKLMEADGYDAEQDHVASTESREWVRRLRGEVSLQESRSAATWLKRLRS